MSTPVAGVAEPLRVSLAERLQELRGEGPLPEALLDVEVVNVRPGDEVLTLLRPRVWAALCDEERDAGRPRPYWARLWPCSRALAAELETWPLEAQRVLELGCGLAVPSMVAARRGATVLATDISPDAVAFAAHNLALAGASGAAALVDWRRPDELLRGAPWDLVLASDVLYAREQAEKLADLLPQLIGRHGRALIADDNPLGVCDFRARARRSMVLATRASPRVRGVSLHALREESGTAADPWPADETVAVAEDGDAWLARQLDRLPDRRQRPLFERWFDSPDERAAIAAREGLPYGQLLRIFNATAPLEPPIRFTFAGVRYEVVAMRGVCDDVAGQRYGRFGEPLTLRVYLTEPDLLPPAMLEAADWNFMGADRPGYVAYAYGSVQDRTIHLAALQSDLAARYSYLFQGRGRWTGVRYGDEVRYEDPVELVRRFSGHVPTLRRAFQRRWPEIVLTAVCAWARTQPGLSRFALLDFGLTAAEARPGHQMTRLYRDLPQRLRMGRRHVRTPSAEYHYRTSELAELERYVARWWSASST